MNIRRKITQTLLLRAFECLLALLDVGKLGNETFQNVKDQIGFCGIWCGSCVAGNGAIAELARRFEEVVKKYRLQKWTLKGFDFKEFEKGLARIHSMHTCVGCRKGGGSKCVIRICALENKVDSCNQCGELISCKRFEHLEKKYPDIRGKLVDLRNSNRQELVEKWMTELRTKWPHCIVLCPSAGRTRPTDPRSDKSSENWTEPVGD